MITQIPASLPIVDEKGCLAAGVPLNWMLSVSNLSVIQGAGSPEGVIEARTTRLYMDVTGSAGSILYIKQLNDIGGDRTQGWTLV